MRPFQFSTIAWGDTYVDLLLNVSLPTQLSPRNLPAVPVGPGSSFRIYTTDEYLDRIQNSPALQRIAALMPTRLTRIENDGQLQSYRALTECHRHSLQEAAKAGACAVFVSPDGVYADGSHARLVELAQAGKDVVMVASIRMTLETFVPDFHRQFAADAQSAVTIRPRQLVQMTMDHLHHVSRELVWPPTSRWPSHLYWTVEDEGLLARCFHVHPMLVAPPAGSVALNATIDGDYVAKTFPSGNQVHVVRNSDELCVSEISRHSLSIKAGKRTLASEEIALWTTTKATPLHIAMFRQPFRFHACQPTAAWLRVERESAQAVRHAVMLDVVEPLRRVAFALHGNDRPAAENFASERIQWLLTGRLDELVADLENRVSQASFTPDQLPRLLAAIDYYHHNRQHLRFSQYLQPAPAATAQSWQSKAS